MWVICIIQHSILKNSLSHLSVTSTTLVSGAQERGSKSEDNTWGYNLAAMNGVYSKAAYQQNQDVQPGSVANNSDRPPESCRLVSGETYSGFGLKGE